MAPLPKPGDNAFENGALDKEWIALVAQILNTLTQKGMVKLPPNAGSAKILFEKENWIIDLTGLSSISPQRVTMVINGVETDVLIPLSLAPPA
jgi:hypothetical protein